MISMSLKHFRMMLRIQGVFSTKSVNYAVLVNGQFMEDRTKDATIRNGFWRRPITVLKGNLASQFSKPFFYYYSTHLTHT
jgi:hypothetical protein